MTRACAMERHRVGSCAGRGVRFRAVRCGAFKFGGAVVHGRFQRAVVESAPASARLKALAASPQIAAMGETPGSPVNGQTGTTKAVRHTLSLAPQHQDRSP